MATRESRRNKAVESGRTERGSGAGAETSVDRLEQFLADKQKAVAERDPGRVAAEEAAIHELEKGEEEKFEEIAKSEAGKASGRQTRIQPKESGEAKLTSQWLREHIDDPESALAALVSFVTKTPGGLEKVRPLLEGLAAEEGGASIVDDLQAEAQKLQKGEQG